jgi:hypothetical protein
MMVNAVKMIEKRDLGEQRIKLKDIIDALYNHVKDLMDPKDH